jgi:hypothetical protein
MPRSARRPRPGLQAQPLRLEPLEDRLLLSDSPVPVASPASGGVQAGLPHTLIDSATAALALARPGGTGTHPGASQRPDAEPDADDMRGGPAAAPPAAAAGGAAGLAFLLLLDRPRGHEEEVAPPRHPQDVDGTTLPGATLPPPPWAPRAAAPGAGRQAPDPPPDGPAPPGPPGDERGGGSAAAPGQHAQEPQEAEADARPSAAAPFSHLPALNPGDWNEAARQFLGALESLGAGRGAPESLWEHLGYWGVAAAATALTFELARQRFGKQRLEELDPLAPCWGFHSPGPG